MKPYSMPSLRSQKYSRLSPRLLLFHLSAWWVPPASQTIVSEELSRCSLLSACLASLKRSQTLRRNSGARISMPRVAVSRDDGKNEFQAGPGGAIDSEPAAFQSEI